MILNLKGLPPSPNELRRRYRSPFAYRRLREKWVELLSYGPASSAEREAWRRSVAHGTKVRLNVRIYHKRLYDADNLIGALKPVIDALVRVGYLYDDDLVHLELGTVEQIVSQDITTVLQLSVVDPPKNAA